MGLTHIVVMLSLISSSAVSGWFFTRRADIARANGKPDESCLAHGEAGRCEFYKCFEQRLPCGAEGYMLKFGVPYCDRFQRIRPAFTEKGQAFINATSQCLTKGLLAFYRQDSVDCHRLSHDAFDAISSCYSANGFCDVLEDNASLFVDVYQPKHLFQRGALKIWREILQVTYHCDPKRVHNFAGTVLNLLSGFFRFFASSPDA